MKFDQEAFERCTRQPWQVLAHAALLPQYYEDIIWYLQMWELGGLDYPTLEQVVTDPVRSLSPDLDNKAYYTKALERMFRIEDCAHGYVTNMNADDIQGMYRYCQGAIDALEASLKLETHWREPGNNNTME